MAEKWFKPYSGKGIQIAVQVAPKSAKNAIDSVVIDANGREILKLRVTAPPDKGKANAAIITVLAKAWKLPGSSISFISGETSRKKLLLVTGDVQALLSFLEQVDKSYKRAAST